MAREALVEALDQRQRQRILTPPPGRLGQRQQLRRQLRRKRRIARLHFAKDTKRLVAAPFLQQQRQIGLRVRHGAIVASGQQQQLVVAAVRHDIVGRRALRLVSQFQRLVDLAGGDQLPDRIGRSRSGGERSGATDGQRRAGRDTDRRRNPSC